MPMLAGEVVSAMATVDFFGIVNCETGKAWWCEVIFWIQSR